MREVWADAIVEENNIPVSMSILRKTLGDQDKRQFMKPYRAGDTGSIYSAAPRKSDYVKTRPR